MYKKIKVIDLPKLQNPSIIDIREPYEFEMGHISKAINIPMNIILDDYDKYLKKDHRYYIYCETNIRSAKVCKFLTDVGYDVCLIDGGYKGWLQQ